MKSTMQMEKKMMGKNNMMGMSTMGQGMPMSTMDMMMIPRCTFKIEKCKDGMKIHCMAPDAMASSMMQNLCSMLGSGMISFQMMMNGMTMMSCNMLMGMCKCEMTPDGVCITCTSGDPDCCKMIEDCCKCMMTMMESGCMCCMSMNNTPVCCGCCE